MARQCALQAASDDMLLCWGHSALGYIFWLKLLRLVGVLDRQLILVTIEALRTCSWIYELIWSRHWSFSFRRASHSLHPLKALAICIWHIGRSSNACPTHANTFQGHAIFDWSDIVTAFKLIKLFIKNLETIELSSSVLSRFCPIFGFTHRWYECDGYECNELPGGHCVCLLLPWTKIY